jgi:polyphosphate kinase
LIFGAADAPDRAVQARRLGAGAAGAPEPAPRLRALIDERRGARWLLARSALGPERIAAFGRLPFLLMEDLVSDTSAPARDLTDAWVNRDLSWLEFNRRVLGEALDERTPLLERVKFLAIFSSNLDEFFMKRIALIRAPKEDVTLSARERREFLARLRAVINGMLDEQARCYRHLRARLAELDVRLTDWGELSYGQQEEASAYFDSEILPVLTPLSLDGAHPFPYVSNLSTSWTFSLEDPGASGDPVWVRVKVPRELPQWLRLQRGVEAPVRVLVSLADVIAANAEKLFPGMVISSASLFRVSRDAEVELEGEAVSKRELVELELRQRRFEPVVRLEVRPNADPKMVSELSDQFALTDDDIYEMPELLDYTTLYEIAGLELDSLRDEPWSPLPPPALDGAQGDIFSAIRAHDILLHHPYDSFHASVERFIREAADDPLTLSIKMTVYRVGDDTPFVRSLIHAAETGKQVACVIELNARFDEERNLHWAGELEKVGAHVVFGISGLKTHSKVALVVRQEETGIRSYAHVATGNYHARTARLYEDIGLLTADPAITRDVTTLFHFLTGRSRSPYFNALMVAPMYMRAQFAALIAGEIENARMGRPARIVAKLNQLEDRETCQLLSDASGAGVPVELIVRGLCCLLPGVPGLTDNIRVRSIIGRFLEHSRIFYFAAGSDDPLDGEFLIGSGDWMRRNLSERVEAAAPIRERRLRARLWEILETCLHDQRNAWQLHADGQYSRVLSIDGDDAIGTHQTLMQAARARHGL